MSKITAKEARNIMSIDTMLSKVYEGIKTAANDSIDHYFIDYDINKKCLDRLKDLGYKIEHCPMKLISQKSYHYKISW